jgi:hypothetical protein
MPTDKIIPEGLPLVRKECQGATRKNPFRIEYWKIIN